MQMTAPIKQLLQQQNKLSQQLFDTKLLNHKENTCQITNVASFWTKISVQFFVRPHKARMLAHHSPHS